MIHKYDVVEYLNTGAIRLRCPECGRQVRLCLIPKPHKIVEKEGDAEAPHEWGVIADIEVKED